MRLTEANGGHEGQADRSRGKLWRGLTHDEAMKYNLNISLSSVQSKWKKNGTTESDLRDDGPPNPTGLDMESINH